MGRLVTDDRKVTVTQITTRYNHGMQNTISERTTRQTLKQVGYSNRTVFILAGIFDLVFILRRKLLIVLVTF